ncbi:MAG: permease-like cell division protein FtsX [Candidatus Azambacteria bacterium]|nr:permease-like cell division protein FtsX [Candidatus Azambacteria bacterium]
MFTALIRIIKSGSVNFWRNGWLSTATVLIMTVALITWTSIFLLNVVLTSVLDVLAEKVDVSVYFELDTKEANILAVKSKLENLEEVKSVEYVSTEKALEIFKSRHTNDDVLLKSIQELSDNPLEASLNILAKDSSKYEMITNFLNEFSTQDGKNIVSKINYAENKIVIDRLNNIISVLRKSGLAASIVLAFIAFLVAFNTVRLAIYSSREEITVMKLVGASNWFVRGPFIIEGVIHGIVASAFSFMVVFIGISFLGPKLFGFLSEIDLVSYVNNNFWALLLLQTLSGVILGVFSSWVAIRKYLKV